MTDFVIGTVAEREDIIDFINYVFSQAHQPHDFKTIVRKWMYNMGVTEHYVSKDGTQLVPLEVVK